MAASTTTKSGGFSPTFLILIVLVVGAFFMMTRSNRRRQQQAQQRMSAATPGARVRTTAGMYATVVSVDGDDVILEVAPGVEVKYMKRAIMDVVPDEEPVNGFASDDAEAGESEDAEAEADGDVTAAERVKKD